MAAKKLPPRPEPKALPPKRRRGKVAARAIAGTATALGAMGMATVVNEILANRDVIRGRQAAGKIVELLGHVRSAHEIGRQIYELFGIEAPEDKE